MENITIEEIRNDFNYLEDNLQDAYLVTVEELVDIAAKLRTGEIDLKDFLAWSVEDIVYYTICVGKHKKDIDFLETDKRAIEIIEKYDIEI